MGIRKMDGIFTAAAMLMATMITQATAAEAPVTRPVGETAPRVIGDIALGEGGVLRGQMLDRQGQPVKQKVVKLVQGERIVTQSVTDDRGNFTVANLRPGLYGIQAKQHNSMHRLWSAQQAPPAANAGLLIVDGEVAARGQIAGLGALGAAGAGAAAVGGYLLFDEFVLDDDPASGN